MKPLKRKPKRSRRNTTALIADKLSVTTRTVEREVKKLRDVGRIERVGGKRYVHWKVNN